MTSRSASTLSARRTSGTIASMFMGCPTTGRDRSGLTAAGATAHDVLVGDELGAVLLHHLAGELAAAYDEHLLVVLLELLHERDEVAVAADDDEGVDVVVREGHFERVERQVDVGAVLVAAGRHHALHEPHGVVRHRTPVVAGRFQSPKATLVMISPRSLMASSTAPMSNWRPSVVFTPISTLSKSMKTAILSRSSDMNRSFVLMFLLKNNVGG